MSSIIQVRWKTNEPSHDDSNMTTQSYFDFPGGKREEQFMSWVSVTLLLLLILSFRSSATAFIKPMGGRASTYTNMTIILYCWVLSATALTVVPNFSTHYNEIIAAALFFPMLFATIGALVVGRFLVRLMYYTFGQCKKKKELLLEQRKSSHKSVMISFHRPFRKLIRTSALCSAGLCFLYAHCWSRDLSAFKVDRQDGAGAVCRAAFSPLTFGGLIRQNERRGADESCIWCLWASAVVTLLSSFLLDEFAGKHLRKTLPAGDVADHPLEQPNSTGVSGYFSDIEINDDDVDDDTSNASFFGEEEGYDDVELSEEVAERPEGTLPMVSWYSILLFNTVFDILIELKVFLGRFDARTLMQPAVKNSATRAEVEHANGESKFDPNNYPSGTVFDCRPQTDDGSGGDEQELWFDFMADCGDGFDSSYHVARMLAQRQLAVRSKGTTSTRVLPRGSFLVVGGDLAYPHPTEESYEKRFFRTFEDAMPPPPSFRREQICVNKPALPVKGWKNCFSDNLSDEKDDKKDLLKAYKGPCAFLIPGNHDWYDGLVTYSRYILSRDWLGGWLLPQTRSYFALKLTHGWWVLAFDLGLSQDIDLNQFKFFVNVAANEMGPSDSCIIVTHEPHWVLSADEKRTPDELPEEYLRELMTHHLEGRIRARFAGDLHHYTRHVPMKPTRSFVNGVANSPLPQLIVSGGGGAFLHGTHTYENIIAVGEDQDTYARVCAYPDEKTSYRLSWLNMWQFRWRNWAFDMFGAAVYFGIASSGFPICGIYSDYLAFNPSHNPFYLMLWVAKTVVALLAEIFSTGVVSLFSIVALAFTLYMVSDPKLKPSTRLLWALVHVSFHVFSALVCLTFVECMAEWSINEGIVKVAASAAKMKRQDQGIDLASSLYDEYKEHFSYFFSTTLSPPRSQNGVFTQFQQLHAQAYDVASDAASWIYYHVPLLQTTLEVFDLPGNIAEKHNDMCKVLCSGGMECMLRSESSRFQQIERSTLLGYLAAVSLYFFILAIPFAGNVFGTWLALTLNVFKAQPNEGFSSLRIRHWKNFLRLHINTNGDLEVFAIGLNRAPKRWIKDALWDGNFEESTSRMRRQSRVNDDCCTKPVSPTWSWERPSKWIPEKHSKRFDPELIDFTRIPKTRPEQRQRQQLNRNGISRNGSRPAFGY